MSSYMQLTITPQGSIQASPTSHYPTSTASHTPTPIPTPTYPHSPTQTPPYPSSSTHLTPQSPSHSPFHTQTPKDSTTPFTLIITKAHIRESLETPFHIECEGYIESMQEQLLSFSDSHAMSSSISHSPLQPHALLDSPATLSIANPYPNSTNTIDQTHSMKKRYTGIISALHYKGAEPSNHTSQGIATLSYKHFFHITLVSTLKRLDYNQAYRIYTDKSILDVIKTMFALHSHTLTKSIDYTHIYHTYHPKELITQYNESDLSFITRVAHNHGIYFYEDEHSIYACDTLKDMPPISIPYNPNPNNALHEMCIQSFFKQDYLSPHSFTQSNANNPLDIYTQSTTLFSSPTHSPTHIPTRTHHTPPYYEYHHNAQMSFDTQPDTLMPLSLKEKYYTLSKNRLFARSNAYCFHLGDSIHITLPSHYAAPTIHSSQGTHTSQETHSPQDYTIIALDQILIDTTSLANIGSNTTPSSVLATQATHTAHTSNNAYANTHTSHLFDTTSHISPLHSSILSHTPSLDTHSPATTSALATPTASSHSHFTSASSHSTASSATTTSASPFIRSYMNTLTLIPISLAFSPSPKAKPTPPSTTQGIVIGEGYIQAKNLKEANASIQQESNTIYTDSYGRVRVRLNSFYAHALTQEALLQQDYSQRDSSQESHSKENFSQESDSKEGLSKENSSHKATSKESHTQRNSSQERESQVYMQSLLSSHTPFLRVSTPIASNHSGFYHTPRVGDEVIISFMDNDIDKPYISGSLYNTHNPSLAHLPKDDHITTLSSKTIGVKEQGRNELTLSNLKDKEQIYIKAQKDYTESINHNFSQTIHNNKDSKVKGSFVESISKYHKQEILGLKDVRIGAEYLTNVALSKDTIVGLSHTLNIGESNKLRVAKDSSEYVGGDKDTSIQGNYTESIQGDLSESVKGNRSEIIEGSLDIRASKDININTESNHTLTSTGAIDMFSNTNTHIQSKEQLSISANNTEQLFESDYNINAGNQITHQVGDTQIIAKGDCVIIKAGGVEVVIDSNGLVVKGGEVKSE